MRTQRLTPGWRWDSRSSSPRRSARPASRASRRGSGSGVGVSSPAGAWVSADDNGITSPLLGHVLVGDALLQQDDALEEGLGEGRADRDVDVEGDDTVHASSHGVASQVRAAAVGAANPGEDVLRVGHMLSETAHGRTTLIYN